MKDAAASFGTASLTSFGIHYEVLARQRFGIAEIAWVHVTPTDLTVCGPRSVPSLQIAETGVVAFARVRNPHAQPVLLTSDLVLRGGYQTRVLERSVIVEGGSAVDVPVRCVEQGRWRPENDRPWALSVGEPTSTETRASFLRDKRVQFQRTRAYELNQQKVWSRVDQELTRTGVQSCSRSYGAYLDGPRESVRSATGRLVADSPALANGLCVCIAGGVAWFEALPTHAHLEVAAPAMLADVIDALRDGRALRRPTASEKAASSTKTLLAWVWNAPLQNVDAVPSTLGDTRVVITPGLSGEALFLGGALVHLAATSVA